ncbi:hypothetical protein DIPPA_10949 [Diplonema papillatum]|nr:hypothetical protein DIPPA_10949 [Diplonema papillatum]
MSPRALACAILVAAGLALGDEAACAAAEAANATALWCVRGAGGAAVAVERGGDCADGVYCPERACPVPLSCPAALLRLGATARAQHRQAVEQECGCLGVGFAVAADEHGAPYCAVKNSSADAFASAFDASAGETRFHHLECGELSHCSPVRAFSRALFYGELASVAPCADYALCKLNQMAAQGAACLGHGRVLDRTGTECSADTKAKYCGPLVESGLCGRCREEGALPRQWGVAPEKKICALGNGKCSDLSAAGGSQAECADEGAAEGIPYPAWCPGTFERVGSIPAPTAELSVARVITLCGACEEENAHPALCCADPHAGTHRTVTHAGDCSGFTERFCPALGCFLPVSASCKASAPASVELEQITEELCDCVGAEFEQVTADNGALACRKKRTGEPWDSNTWDDDAAARVFRLTTCGNLAACGVKGELYRAVYADLFSDDACGGYAACVVRRRGGLANVCEEEPVEAAAGACEEAVASKHCTERAAAIGCHACLGDGSECVGKADQACGGPGVCDSDTQYKCSSVFGDGDEPSPAPQPTSQPESPEPSTDSPGHISCMLCEEENAETDLLCLLADGAEKAHTVDPSISPLDTETLCHELPCAWSAGCERAYHNNHDTFLALNKKDTAEICACLGAEFGVMFNASTGLDECLHRETRNSWDHFTRRNKRRYFSHLTCAELAACETPAALDRARYINSLPEECAQEKRCERLRSKGETLACVVESVHDESGALCSYAIQQKYCGNEVTALYCELCEDGLDPLSFTCITSDETCLPRSNRVDCNGYFCPDIFSDSVYGPTAPVVAHQGLSSDENNIGWYIAGAVAAVFCVSGIVVVQIMQKRHATLVRNGETQPDTPDSPGANTQPGTLDSHRAFPQAQLTAEDYARL